MRSLATRVYRRKQPLDNVKPATPFPVRHYTRALLERSDVGQWSLVTNYNPNAGFPLLSNTLAVI